ncbi:succinate dehydrogenase iron-sulfur subunit [Phycomyces blakesleeanus]|uniref:Succinate dehydrogenase iron-sulfur subunit n=2 Tax=Phycomyces blakesleeanus TaxID=4837 RepID=A0ABR3BHL8_PHYBL
MTNILGTAFHATKATLSVPQDPNDPWTGPWGLKATHCTTNTANTTKATTPSETTNHPDYFLFNDPIDQPRKNPRCFDRLQSLDAQLEPLITNPSVHRILKRQGAVVLSREYRRRSSQPHSAITSRRLLKEYHAIEDSQDMFKRALLEQTEKKGEVDGLTESEILVDSKAEEEIMEDEIARDQNEIDLSVYDFDEYEQQQPSPWSQSPAPSPAMMDPDVNPFFQTVPDIDDEAFNPVSPETYGTTAIPFPPPAANVHSVVHLPIVHPFETDNQSPQHPVQPSRSNAQPPPFAILSFLSPVVPYPPVLQASLTSIAPFIATSLANALENSRLARKDQVLRPTTSHTHGHSHHRSHHKRGSVDRSSSNRTNLTTDTESAMSTPTAYTNTGANHQAIFLENMIHSRSSLETVREHHPIETLPLRDLDMSSGSEASSYASTFSAPAALAAQTHDRHLNSRQHYHNSISHDQTVSEADLLDTEHAASYPRRYSFTRRPEEGGVYRGRSKSPCKRRPRIRRKQNKLKTRHKVHRRHEQRHAQDDDDFHYHHKISGRNKDGVEQYVVAPKSSLLRLVIDGIPIHVFTCSTTTGQVTWVNNRTLQYTGRSLQDHLGSNWLSHMHPDDQADCCKAWEAAFDQGNGFAGEFRLRRFDGIYRCFLWRIVPLRDLKGRIIHWFGNTDVHDQHVAKESTLRQMEIESSERKYRMLAEAIPQIVFTFSPGIGLTYANDKWESYSNQPFEKTVGLGFMSQVHSEDRHKLQLPDLVRHKTAGVAWQNEIRLQSSDGDYRWFLVKCISVDELDTGQVRWFGTCTDINDHKLLEHKLKEAHDAAQKSTESKTRFLSNMSHEIRTPLIGITGMLNFLLDTELTPEQMDYVHTIQQSAESLLVVINDILDLSKVEAGMMKLEWEPFSLVSMIEDANELLSTLAVQKGLELSFWADDDVPDVVVGDRIRLRQVLLNLIGNAIKFTSKGEIYTQCSLQHFDKEESELTLLFEVVDTGTGFDADGEAVMFKPFSQVDSSSTRKHGGSGLGLVISRQLIELHGGTMNCRSKKNQGSTFFFTAKFGVPASQTHPQPQTPQNEAADPFSRSHTYCPREEGLPFHNDSVNKPQPSKDFGTSQPLLNQFSQSPELPCSVELMHDALLNKAATMRLMPPPVRSDRLTLPKIVLLEQIADQMTPMILTSPELEPLRSKLKETYLMVLIVCEWPRSRSTMVKHSKSILSTLVKSNQDLEIETATNHLEAVEQLASPLRPAYDYTLVSLASEQQILMLMRMVCSSSFHQGTNLLVVTTPMQRSLIMEGSKGQEQSVLPRNCGFVFKPLKRSKLSWYFGVRPISSGSDDPKNMSAPDAPQQRVVTQKEVFQQMESDVGGKGFRVLLVEDNPVNQKVLTRYLVRVGLNVEVACDGEVCINLFNSHPHSYYSLILCDLFMPVKDGYEATREIREWETANGISPEKQVPIVALSANVMSDVAEKCLASGFSTYISKPVNFAMLSDVIRGYLLPSLD